MSKYSNHLKLAVVEYYLNSGCGYHVAANHFNIKSYSVVERWVKKYKEHGAKGLLRNFNQYDGNFKLNVLMVQ